MPSIIEGADKKAPAPFFVAPRWYGTAVLGFLVIVAILYGVGVSDHWRFSRDNPTYLGLARTLAETGRYEFNGRVETFILPGFPLMLSAVYRIFGENFLAINALMALLGLATVGAAALLFREMALSWKQQAACLLIFGLSRTLYLNAFEIMTDTPFTLFVILTLYAGLRMMHAQGWRSWAWTAAAMLLALASCGVRPVGPALVVALAVAPWLKPKSERRAGDAAARSALILAPFFAILAFWAWRHVITVDDRNYFHVFFGRRGVVGAMWFVVSNSWRFLEALPDALLGTPLKLKYCFPVDLPLAAGAALGLAALYRKGDRAPVLYAVICLAGTSINLVNRRYMLPTMPVLIPAIVVAAGMAGAWLACRFRALTQRRLAWGAVVLAAAIALTNLAGVTKLIWQARSADFYAATKEKDLLAYFDLAEWLKANTEPEDQVVTSEDGLIGYVARRGTMNPRWMFGREDSARTIRRALREGLRYAVTDPWSDKEAWTAMAELRAAHPEAFETVRRFDRLELIRLHPGSAELRRRDGNSERPARSPDAKGSSIASPGPAGR